MSYKIKNKRILYIHFDFIDYENRLLAVQKNRDEKDKVLLGRNFNKKLPLANIRLQWNKYRMIKELENKYNRLVLETNNLTIDS